MAHEWWLLFGKFRKISQFLIILNFANHGLTDPSLKEFIVFYSTDIIICRTPVLYKLATPLKYLIFLLYNKSQKTMKIYARINILKY